MHRNLQVHTKAEEVKPKMQVAATLKGEFQKRTAEFSVREVAKKDEANVLTENFCSAPAPSRGQACAGQSKHPAVECSNQP